MRKTVTVVFCDVTGSTALGEQLDPESAAPVMGALLRRACAAVVERHGGTVEKFIGDAVMAVFGVPVVHEDDALRAVRAAAEMRERLDALNEELEGDWGVAYSTYGPASTRARSSHGDARLAGTFVARATRSTSPRASSRAAAPGEILIGDADLPRSSATRSRSTTAVEPLELKGKTEPVPAYRLLAVRARGAGVATPAGLADRRARASS